MALSSYSVQTYEPEDVATVQAGYFGFSGARRGWLEIRIGDHAVRLTVADVLSLSTLADEISAAVEWATEEESERQADGCHVRGDLMDIQD